MAMLSHRLADPRSGVSLREALDRLFSEALVPPRLGSAAAQGPQVPPANVYETDANLMVIMPLPGVSPNDIEIELLGTQLSVRTPARGGVVHQDEGTQERHTRHDVGEGTRVDYPDAIVPHHHHGPAPHYIHEAGQGKLGRRCYQHGFQIGPYAYTIELPYPVDADRVHASYEHGLLSLRFPRPDTDLPRRVPLQPGE
jgi:HSP20 family molecular chaperone IbpA